MFKYILTALLCISFIRFDAISKETSVDDIIAKLIKARGGNEAAMEIKTMKITGKMSAMGMDFPLTTQYKAPDKSKMEFEMMGMKITNAINGKEGWFINPMMGNDKPTKMPDKEYQENKGKLDFVNLPVARYKENGLKITLQGTQVVGGKECFKLFVVTKEAEESYLFIDVIDYLPIMQRSKGNVMGKMADLEMYFKDYSNEKNLKMPHTIESMSDGQAVMTIKFDKIEIDADIPDSVFEMPK